MNTPRRLLSGLLPKAIVVLGTACVLYDFLLTSAPHLLWSLLHPEMPPALRSYKVRLPKGPDLYRTPVGMAAVLALAWMVRAALRRPEGAFYRRNCPRPDGCAERPPAVPDTRVTGQGE